MVFRERPARRWGRLDLPDLLVLPALPGRPVLQDLPDPRGRPDLQGPRGRPDRRDLPAVGEHRDARVH